MEEDTRPLHIIRNTDFSDLFFKICCLWTLAPR